ncbi:hypothetical protein BCU68_08895 [Vibrio sp. 10N.286.49.B3]|nr:hypothetical protein BCU68_08895 [Vibrio sp. 10N.286.49.B3]
MLYAIGLLLLANLDKAFDLGLKEYIKFIKCDGHILATRENMQIFIGLWVIIYTFTFLKCLM